MPRTERQKKHKARVLAMQGIFQHSANPRPLDQLLTFDWMDYAISDAERDLATKLIRVTLEHLTEIDERIENHLVNWEMNRVSKVSLAILRIILAQGLFFDEKIDAAILIDEAILLAKQYDSSESQRFMNGILDEILVQQKIPALKEKIKIKKK